MRHFKNILVTGGSGFIGINMIRYFFSDKTDFCGRLVNLDKLTYASNNSALADIQKNKQDRYYFENYDICDLQNNIKLIERYEIDAIIHLAAESHVDRSIHDPGECITTNIIGTFSLLEACRTVWGNRQDVLFHHVSTDEVYGSLGESGSFSEKTAYAPRSPYSASKAGSDHIVSSYYTTFGLPVTITNCSNNYGPFQYPEKLLPLMVLNMLDGNVLPVYGDGKNVRDWVYVDDHISAIWAVMQKGQLGNRYNIGGEISLENIELIKMIASLVSKYTGKPENELLNLVSFVKDRPGHDRRYAVDCRKIKTEIGWCRSMEILNGMDKTIRWYIENEILIKNLKSRNFGN